MYMRETVSKFNAFYNYLESFVGAFYVALRNRAGLSRSLLAVVFKIVVHRHHEL